MLFKIVILLLMRIRKQWRHIIKEESLNRKWKTLIKELQIWRKQFNWIQVIRNLGKNYNILKICKNNNKSRIKRNKPKWCKLPLIKGCTKKKLKRLLKIIIVFHVLTQKIVKHFSILKLKETKSRIKL